MMEVKKVTKTQISFLRNEQFKKAISLLLLALLSVGHVLESNIFLIGDSIEMMESVEKEVDHKDKKLLNFTGHFTINPNNTAHTADAKHIDFSLPGGIDLDVQTPPPELI